MSTRKNKANWVIVIFADSNDYSVVPINWLVQDENNNLSNSNIKFCYWPLGRVTSTNIMNALDPEPTWLMCGIKIVGGNKTYDNFNKAWHTRVTIESENEDVQLMSKRKHTTSDSSSDEDHGYIITPALNLPNNEKDVHYTELQSVNNSQGHEQLTKQSFGTYQSLLSDQINNPTYVQSSSIYQSLTQDEQSTSTQNTLQQSCNPPNINTYGFYEDRLDKLNINVNNILQGQTATNLMLNCILAKIEILEANFKNTSQSNVPSVYIDPDFLSKFPLKNSTELLLVENLINNEPQFVIKLESFIKNIGGNCAAHHVKRVMSQLFTDEYCVHISWTGRGWGKDMTKLKETELIKIVRKVIQQCSSTLFDNSQFEKEVTERLRTANTRFKSFQNRIANPK